jgi:hypothetical protein
MTELFISKQVIKKKEVKYKAENGMIIKRFRTG